MLHYTVPNSQYFIGYASEITESIQHLISVQCSTGCIK